MKGLKKVMIIGNSGKETALKTLADGTAVARLAIATSEIFRLKNGGTSTTTE